MKEKFSWYIYSLKNVFDENLNDEERELLNWTKKYTGGFYLAPWFF
jgi:hypothetical protein